jgi:hypothetical protein
MITPSDKDAQAKLWFQFNVQAGSKTQAGGFRGGLVKPAYQPMLEAKTPEMEAAKRSRPQPSKAGRGCVLAVDDDPAAFMTNLFGVRTRHHHLTEPVLAPVASEG